MSTVPEAPPTAGSAIFGEAPPGAALVLAAFDIAMAAWVACIFIGLGRADSESGGQETPRMDFWFAWLSITMIFVFFLLLISVASLVKVPVRSEPRIFRVLLGGTIALALVLVAPLIAVSFGHVFSGSFG